MSLIDLWIALTASASEGLPSAHRKQLLDRSLGSCYIDFQLGGICRPYQDMRVISINISSMGLSCGGTCPHRASNINGAFRTAPPVSTRTRKSVFCIQLFKKALYCLPSTKEIACRKHHKFAPELEVSIAASLQGSCFSCCSVEGQA